MNDDDDERSWTLYYGIGMGTELWLSREYFFWRIMKVDVLVTIKNCHAKPAMLLATSESLQAAIKQGWNWGSALKNSVKSAFRAG